MGSTAFDYHKGLRHMAKLTNTWPLLAEMTEVEGGSWIIRFLR
jgi:hypothetical protein